MHGAGKKVKAGRHVSRNDFGQRRAKPDVIEPVADQPPRGRVRELAEMPGHRVDPGLDDAAADHLGSEPRPQEDVINGHRMQAQVVHQHRRIQPAFATIRVEVAKKPVVDGAVGRAKALGARHDEGGDAHTLGSKVVIQMRCGVVQELGEHGLRAVVSRARSLPERHAEALSGLLHAPGFFLIFHRSPRLSLRPNADPGSVFHWAAKLFCVAEG